MWQQINIHTSKANKEIVQKLSRKILGGAAENVIARIALGYSLQTGRKFTSGEFRIYDSGGKEYKEHILFDAKYRDYFVALICQHYEVHKTNDNIPRYIKLHIDDGLEAINQLFESNPKYTIFDFLTDHLENGIANLEHIEVSLDHVKNLSQKIQKSYFSSPLTVEIGREIGDDDSSIQITPNNIALYGNAHMAVAGKSGMGKTRFALELLSQFTSASNGQVNFIYLDFKGLKGEDLENYKPFFKHTKSTFVDAPQTPFPLNPLTFIDNVNDKNKLMGINKFVDIIAKYANIGKKQEQSLKDATKEAFLEKKSGEYPTINDVNEKLQDLYGDKRDTLTEVMEGLSEFDVFDKKPKGSFLNQNYYLSLSGDLPNSVRFTSIFLIINYIYNTFMNMENAPVENGYQGMRYVLLIDEAHVIFKEKKSQDLLEKILREIRSKGVSVILLSQGIEEFNQPNFDFSSMCESAFLMDINNKGNVKMINKFLGLSDAEGKKVARSMERIQKGQTISNIKEFEIGQLFELKQFNAN
ncbi:DndE family protein [Reichenbachiella sp.]|uniref:DndE family protein n=1 Tax=Reichenbachiella sp. TaxID=2184521 RepID=UPI00329984C3